MKVKIITLLILASPALGSLKAQEVDRRLWGSWDLQSLSLTTLINGQQIGQPLTFPIETIWRYLSNETFQNVIPIEIPLTVYCFDNNVGLCTTGASYAKYGNINEKGTFSTTGNRLALTMNRNGSPLVFNFTYEITDGDKLILGVTQNRNVMQYRGTATFRKLNM
jgi:hypothetical protein